MSSSELVAFTIDLSTRKVVEMPQPQLEFESRLEPLEDGLAKVKNIQFQVLEQQQQLLDAVTALARHVVLLTLNLLVHL
jgi:hypothetical protein